MQERNQMIVEDYVNNRDMHDIFNRLFQTAPPLGGDRVVPASAPQLFKLRPVSCRYPVTTCSVLTNVSQPATGPSIVRMKVARSALRMKRSLQSCEPI